MERSSLFFFALLRLAMKDKGCDKELSEFSDLSAKEWTEVYRMASLQSLTGVVYRAVEQLPEDLRPARELLMQWFLESERIAGLNRLMTSEAARLTQAFAAQGRKTAILKGQANARLYPDMLSRQPGDIDIWVESFHERESTGKSVRKDITDLLIQMGLLSEVPTIANAGKNGKATTSYHHIHLPPTKDGVIVEVHFRPSSGNFNPLTNSRLQRWLEQEIQTTTMTEEGFCVPTTRFALVMQLSHIQRHFLSGGIGLRQICDYYWLLRTSTEDDRLSVSRQLKRFGLYQSVCALMWLLGEQLHLETNLMISPQDSQRGVWMLREIMSGGNFGHYASRQQKGMWQRFFAGKIRHLQLMRFNFWEMLWMELSYWSTIFNTLPERIRRRSLSLREAK